MQQDLADTVGVAQIQISNLERGKKHTLTDSNRDRLFRELAISDKLGQREFLKFWRQKQNADRV